MKYRKIHTPATETHSVHNEPIDLPTRDIVATIFDSCSLPEFSSVMTTCLFLLFLRWNELCTWEQALCTALIDVLTAVPGPCRC